MVLLICENLLIIYLLIINKGGMVQWCMELPRQLPLQTKFFGWNPDIVWYSLLGNVISCPILATSIALHCLSYHIQYSTCYSLPVHISLYIIYLQEWACGCLKVSYWGLQCQCWYWSCRGTFCRIYSSALRMSVSLVQCHSWANISYLFGTVVVLCACVSEWLSVTMLTATYCIVGNFQEFCTIALNLLGMSHD